MKGFVVESMIDKSVLNFKENLAVSASNLSVISGMKIFHSLVSIVDLKRSCFRFEIKRGAPGLKLTNRSPTSALTP